MQLTRKPSLLNLLPLILGPLFAFLILQVPTTIAVEAKLTAGIITWVASWWLSPLIPLHISGIVGLLLAHFFGLSTWSELVKPFSDPIIFLFMGGFFIAQAVEFHRLDHWLVQKTLSHNKIRGNSQRLFLGLILITAFMSAFLSNTATAALVIPIGIQILRSNDCDMASQSKLLLLLAAAASIGGTMTPVGSPPNMIALGLMQKITGTRPDFFTWVTHMVPLSLTLLGAIIFLYWNSIKILPKTSGIKSLSLPATIEHIKIGVVLITTAFLWALPGLSPLFASKEFSLVITKLFPESVVGICAGVLLMLIPTSKGPLLPWKEAQKIDWGTLLLFGSGISLGELAFKTGLAQVLAQQIDAFSGFSPEIMILLAVLGTLFFTEFASNTATANLIVPVLLVSPAFLMNPDRTIYAVVAAANLAFMLPVGTPPNAIVYSTGLIRLPTMMKWGFASNMISATVIIIFSLLFF